ncbi:MAG: zinc ribbon domain-containing protein, partial [Chloroflexota bacterium]
ADESIECEQCAGERTARVLSVFFAHSTGSGGETANTGGGCCGGECGCGHSHN